METPSEGFSANEEVKALDMGTVVSGFSRKDSNASAVSHRS